ncbi:unnamed protein product [Merluccius merluccius]
MSNIYIFRPVHPPKPARSPHGPTVPPRSHGPTTDPVSADGLRGCAARRGGLCRTTAPRRRTRQDPPGPGRTPLTHDTQEDPHRVVVVLQVVFLVPWSHQDIDPPVHRRSSAGLTRRRCRRNSRDTMRRERGGGSGTWEADARFSLAREAAGDPPPTFHGRFRLAREAAGDPPPCSWLRK